ncbi:MAG: TlpA family protein disulfide reductase [Sphingobacteriaceae bacterium]|nr:MAG: TlpA family protein disulfide reductase [Sphingobacteriaceae bacterium]
MMSNYLNKVWLLLRRHYATLLFMLAAGILVFSPDAKAWFLRRLISTGLFNAHINTKASQQHTTNDFAYTDTNGTIINTALLRGKVVYINFWASWCPPCRAEFPSVQALYNQLKNNPTVVFLTINEDNDIFTAQKYLSNEGYTVPLFKASGVVPDAVYTGTLPTTVVLDKAGKIRYKHEGFAKYDTKDFILQLQQLTKE